MFAALRAIGAYVPEEVLTNADLEQKVDTSDEWITKRTGIKERRIATNITTSLMGVKAAEQALERTSVNKNEIDLLICATISPDYFCMPSTATQIANSLGLNEITAFDISAACSGFIYALQIAKAFIESGMKKNVLIVGSERMSAITDYSDRATCILFGDGAGAAIISATDEKKEAIVDIHTASNGSYADFLMTPDSGTGNPFKQEKEACSAYIQMRGNETFKLAVKTLTKDVVDILKNNGYQKEDIDFFVPHQANYRIIKAVGDALEFDASQVALTVHKFGNTSGASIPMAINDLYEDNQLKPGAMLLLDAFGGGMTWGSALLPFSPR